MIFARPRLAPFLRDRLNVRDIATVVARTEERERGSLPVSLFAPSPDHRPKCGR
jgi:hypothetical protein